MTIKGVGTDLVDVTRIKKAMERHPQRFADKILSDFELIEYESLKLSASERFVAKRFAIKEAVSKALGTGIAQGVDWKHMTLKHLDSGQPIVELDGAAQARLIECGAQRVDVSLSDEGDLVSAFAVIS